MHDCLNVFTARRPTARQVIGWTLGVACACALFAWLLPSNPATDDWPPASVDIGLFVWMTPFWLVFTWLFLFVFWAQHVIVDGSTIRVKHLPTLQRWRTIDATDVRRIVFVPAGFQQVAMALNLYLAPDANGRSAVISFGKMVSTDETADIDNPVFIAVTAAVARANPGIVVENLPWSYAGRLRDPSALNRCVGA